MPTRLNANFPRPTDPDEFEALVRDICALEWGDPHTEKHGRRGQKQNGVDVYGRPTDLVGVYRGAQCKLRTKGEQLTESEIEAEVAEARDFPHQLERLILVTDAPRDKNTQILVDQISEREMAIGGFQVAIWFWDNLTERLAAHRRLIVKYYPEFFANLTTLPIAERLNVYRIQILRAETPPSETADRIFQDVFRYGHARRGGLPTIDIAARSRNGRPDSVLLDMNWQSRLSTTRFPSPEEWQEIFVPALAAVRSQILNQSDRSRIQISCQLPLPAAFAIGFDFNVRVARVGVWARRTGTSDFKQQFWLSDVQFSDIEFPVEWFKRPPDGGSQSAIVEIDFVRIDSQSRQPLRRAIRLEPRCLGSVATRNGRCGDCQH